MATEEATLDLKKTINLPKTKFAQKANLPQTEPARLKKWADMKLYEKIQQARAGAQKFFFAGSNSEQTFNSNNNHQNNILIFEFLRFY